MIDHANISNSCPFHLMLNLGLVAPPTPYKFIGSLLPNLTVGGIGKCQKYLYILPQTFTDIRVLKMMNMS